MTDSGTTAILRNGTRYQIHSCKDSVLQLTPQRLREEIRAAMKRLSAQSRWQRFASPVHELSEKQLDYLADLDGISRVAYCAVITQDGVHRGIGLARYVTIPGEPGTAEFAVTVMDEFQGQGVGHALLLELIKSAQQNGLSTLRGYVLASNKGMLKLCRELQASISSEDTFIRADIPVPPLDSMHATNPHV